MVVVVVMRMPLLPCVGKEKKEEEVEEEVEEERQVMTMIRGEEV